MTDLDARYGRKPAKAGSVSTPDRRWWFAVAALTLGVIVFWAFTAMNSSATIETQTAGFRIHSPASASVDARVSVQPGTPLACAIEAQNERSTVVGWKVVELEPSPDAHQVVHVELATTQPASLVQVRECWVVE